MRGESRDTPFGAANSPKWRVVRQARNDPAAQVQPLTPFSQEYRGGSDCESGEAFRGPSGDRRRERCDDSGGAMCGVELVDGTLQRVG